MVDMITTAYILAGGRSRRMGRDKMFLVCNGDSLLNHIITTCKQIFPTVKLSAKNAVKFQALNIETVSDFPNADGPLAGVIAILQDCESECCFVTAVDLYDLNKATITKLLSSYHKQQYLGITEAGRIQPLCGIYHKSALPELLKAAKRKEYRMTDVVSNLDCELIKPVSQEWRNINTMQDYQCLK